MNIVLEFLLLGAIAASFVGIFIFLKGKMPQSKAYRYAVGLGLVAVFLLFWSNGAVGIIGSSNNDANMMYVALLTFPFIGALISRLQARGMAVAMFTTALGQVVIAAIALGAGLGSDGPIWPRDLLFITAFFSALWIGSALLFRKAAEPGHSA